MKTSHSIRWLVAWVLLFLALITVVLGIFTLPADLATGGGLLILGVSGAVLMGWIFRKGQGKSSAQKRWGAGLTAAASLVLGSFLIAAGEKNSLLPVQTAGEEGNESLSSSVTSTPPSTSSSTSSTLESPTALTVASTVQVEPEPVTITSSLFMAPEEVTTTATVYVPVPQQNPQTPQALASTEPSASRENLVETSQQEPEWAAGGAEDPL